MLASLVAVMVVPAATASAAERYPMSETVFVHNQPSTSEDTRIGEVWKGERVEILCQDNGPEVKGNAVWDYIQYPIDGTTTTKRGFVADFYVHTGVVGALPGVPFGNCADPPAAPAPPPPPAPDPDAYPVLPDPGTAQDGSTVPSLSCLQKYGPLYCEFGTPRIVRCWVDGILFRSPAICLSFTHQQTQILSSADNPIVKEVISHGACASVPGPRFFGFFSPTGLVCNLMVGPLIEGAGKTSADAIAEKKCLGMRLSLARAKEAGWIDLEREQDKVFRKVTCPL